MTDQLITHNDVTQAVSQMLVEVATGRSVKKTHLEQVIATSDALGRRMQTHINAVKVMIECKKHGIDFAAAMRELRELDGETSNEFQRLLDQPAQD